ncbi:Pectin degradation repressor protein KdgR [Pseudooceanicola marinus]|uniref:Pectin degradation repressor protein KdgR n=1 Tax=Pseudooceanicola marinus TaxID=396013 RepID=A0A1X7A911_9RHOB|nr:IclR family transcriptional regulator [Pseudooceanicola marinus]PJE26531.1 IclR family transcriptional regulator [Pseudooceanicola marinus]SLN73534.1 Pectin degradation repressor protein KdgR [Pseudooceanicola marinus]
MDRIYSNRIQDESGKDGGVRPLSTALKVLEVLAFFSDKRRPLRLSDVTTGLGLSRATAYQRLLTLVAAGWLEQDEGGAYRLSMLATRMAVAALDQADLGTRADPVLHRLAEATGETSSLSIIDRGQPCIVARVETDTLLRAEQKMGTMMSLEGSASGRILVAYADAAQLERLRRGPHPLPAEDMLPAIREKGYALSSGYTQTGVIAIAAPVFDQPGRCSATLSLVVPQIRFDEARFAGPLVEAAAELSRHLQGDAS